MEMKKCINCNEEIQNNFCSHCGQRTDVKRITFREGWNDFWARIYGFDGMFPRTLRDLTVRPGKVAMLFIEGNRARYYGPVGYFFLMITLFLLVLSLMDINYLDFTKSVGQNDLTTQKDKIHGVDFRLIAQFFSDNLKAISFIIIPLQAIGAKYIFFRKDKYNFIEHMVLPFYVQGHIYWVNIVGAIYFKFSHSLALNIAGSFLAFAYFPYSYVTLFTDQPKIKAFLKGLGVLVVGQLLTGALALIIGYIALKINPDLLQLIKPSNNK
jgi:Protein of unknown function (DUF3667)